MAAGVKPSEMHCSVHSNMVYTIADEVPFFCILLTQCSSVHDSQSLKRKY